MPHGLSHNVIRRIAALCLLALLCSPLAGFSTQAGRPQSLDAEAYQIQAAYHHDLAVLYLKNGEIEKGLAEARQILKPQIPPELEEAVAMSMSILSDKLASVSRFDQAQALLDETFKVIVQVVNRVRILQLKSRLYLQAGENDKAIETWKRAEELKARIRSEN
jgi:tetratricopeptide (TPR) repeat protein